MLNIGGVIETASWKEKPDAILLAWQGGQEGGNAVTDILIGKVNPSGKLPMTFPVKLEDHASNANFPLEGGMMDLTKFLFPSKDEKPENDKIKNKDFTNYDEGIYVGYRHFDKSELEVSFSFGYGLSYTEFSLSDLTLSLENHRFKLGVTVTNEGSVSGKEVVQVYSSKPDTSIDRPVQELRSFAKTQSLNPDESVKIKIEIPLSQLSYWSEETSKWVLEKGMYIIKVGNSSRDTFLTEQFEINEE